MLGFSDRLSMRHAVPEQQIIFKDALIEVMEKEFTNSCGTIFAYDRLSPFPGAIRYRDEAWRA